MRVHIVGAGVMGLSTALALTERGCEVEVFDPAQPGCGASHANAGQLSYAYVAPLADPDALRKLPGWLVGRESPTRVYRPFDSRLWLWSMRFIRACTREKAEHGTAVLGALGLHSQKVLQCWRERYELDFDWNRSGKLIIHRRPDEWSAARNQVARQSALGVAQQLLTPDEIVAMEPSLAHLKHDIQGGVWTPTEEVGDCFKLCNELARTLESLGGRINRARVTRIHTAGRHGLRLVTDNGEVPSSATVVAAGIGSRSLLKPLGIPLPLYPLKGYSLTYEAAEDLQAPRISVTDFHHKIVCARIGTRLRLAGMADMDGYDHRIRTSRMNLLKAQARALVPDIARCRPPGEWVGLRPATPDSLPLVGRTRVEGLWTNTGQGALGFTLAPASAVALADKMLTPCLIAGSTR